MRTLILVIVFSSLLLACKKEQKPISEEFHDSVDTENYIIIDGITYSHMLTMEKTSYRNWDAKFNVVDGGWWNKVPYAPTRVNMSYAGTNEAHLDVSIQSDSLLYKGSAKNIKVWVNSGVLHFDSIKIFQHKIPVDSSNFFYVSGQWRYWE